MLINDSLAEFLLGEEKEQRPSEKGKKMQIYLPKRKFYLLLFGWERRVRVGKIIEPSEAE